MAALNYVYTTGPTTSLNDVRSLGVIILNNSSAEAQVRIKAYDISGDSKTLILDNTTSITALSAYYPVVEAPAYWEVQFITNSPLIRIFVIGLDSSGSAVPYNIYYHTDLVPTRGGSLSGSESSVQLKTWKGIKRLPKARR